MQIKDYYKILNLAYTANDQEIKKAYRQMAMRFHPDKNEGNQIAENHFKEVQEAYEVLSDPRRRSAYNQQRWYRQSNHKQAENIPLTPVSILHKCRMLNRYMSTLDAFHINQLALNQYIHQLLSESTLQFLLAENDTSINELIIMELLKSIHPLPIRHIENITKLFEKLAANNGEIIENIRSYLKKKKTAAYWERWLPFVILCITIFLCLLIYIISKP